MPETWEWLGVLGLGEEVEETRTGKIVAIQANVDQIK
jgi:hypothetical protein